MSDWRKKLLKVFASDIPFTLEQLQSNSINIGDYLTPIDDIYDLKTKKVKFLKNNYYEVTSIINNGVVLSSEEGPHHIHFNTPDGGGQWFLVSKLSNDERLGILGSIPFDILKVLNTYKYSTINGILKELEMKYSLPEKSKIRKELRNNIMKSLLLLRNEEYIEPANFAGSYKITLRGRAVLAGQL
jgi:hypothetical protein